MKAPNINRGPRLMLPGKQIVPSPGDHVMECGGCQGKVFGVFVRVAPLTSQASVADIVCTGCGKTWEVEKGEIACAGQVRPNAKGEGKVLINA